jgi:hypothetical protein
MRILHENSPRGEKLREQTKAAFGGKLDWPSLMYSAVGMRGILPPLPPSRVPHSHAQLAIGYYNVMLPTDDYLALFSPTTDGSAGTGGGGKESLLQSRRSEWFWRQVREARRQGSAVTKHPNFMSRSVEHGKERYARAKVFARQDDIRLGLVPPPPPPPPTFSTSQHPPSESSPPSSRGLGPGASTLKHPSAALIGLSLIGDLDRLYIGHQFPNIKLLFCTSGTRKGPGALLIFSHTLAERLYIHVGWDKGGFEEGLIEDFADGLVACIEEFALDNVQAERELSHL